MSLLVYGVILFLLSSPLVVLSSSVLERVEVVRHEGSPPAADAYSNPRCRPEYCQTRGTHCYKPDCCKCQCPSNEANYIVNERQCFSRIELNKMNSTKCKYSIRKPEDPLLGLPLTEEMGNNATFNFTVSAEHKTLIPCNESIKVGWEYRDAHGEWKTGQGNIFEVEVHIAPHPTTPKIQDQRVIESMKWTGKLSPENAGLLIRFIFSCDGKDQGCALAKIKGNHIYDSTRPLTARPPPATTTGSAPTSSNPESTTPSHNNTKEYQQGNKNKAPTGNASAIFGPILGVLGLVCLIGVVCVVAARYRKRKQNQDQEANSVAQLEEYQDPIYADINKVDFDNQAYIKASLGPLPKVPGSESAYEPLNTLTRNSPDYDNPKNGVKPGVDYDNPPAGKQTGNDYDNPPVTGGMKNTENDYDNPPVTGGMKNTGDYDNPTAKGEAENNQDYDNPPAKNDTHNNQSDTAEDTFF